MTRYYFIRHGQAGSRDNYDVLSEVGQEQAKRLGEYFATREIRFTALYCGTMVRQRLTAEIVCEKLREQGLISCDLNSDERWNEFSLASVYRYFAPRLCEDDADFARDFREMQEILLQDPHSTAGAAGRCDVTMFLSWIANRYPDYDGELWTAFRDRIKGVAAGLESHGEDEVVCVFTSATPISVLSGSAIGLENEQILRLAGVLYNSGITEMRKVRDQVRLVTFNGAPHLPEELKTFR